MARKKQRPNAKGKDFEFVQTSPNGEGYRLKKKISISAKTKNQRDLLKSIKSNLITIASGPPGTGKTLLSVVSALDAFFQCRYGKIIFTRPCIEAAGESIGFLPGDLNEKISPYMMPIMDYLSDYMDKNQIARMMNNEDIQTVPLAFMRGCSFRNAFVLLDEAQNTTPKQMKMFLTRIGENCKVVLTGDPNQSDISGLNGLTDMTTRLEGVSDIGIVNLYEEDIMRHDIVKLIEEKYDDV